MAIWVDRLLRRTPPVHRLPGLLAGYPPYRIPHPGAGKSLTLAQAEANLAFLLANKAQRLQTLSALLSRFGIDLPDGLQAADPAPLLDALWRWAGQEWPSVFDPRLEDIDTWLNSTRDGADIVFSLLTDVALLLGEMVLVRRPDYRWALDLDPANRADRMLSWQRPIVLRPADGMVPTLRLDPEHAAFISYRRCARPGFGIQNDLEGGVLHAINSAHELFWRENGPPTNPWSPVEEDDDTG